MSGGKKLFCSKCAFEARRHGAVVVAQGAWISECYGCGEKQSQAYEVIKPRPSSSKAGK